MCLGDLHKLLGTEYGLQTNSSFVEFMQVFDPRQVGQASFASAMQVGFLVVDLCCRQLRTLVKVNGLIDVERRVQASPYARNGKGIDELGLGHAFWYFEKKKHVNPCNFDAMTMCQFVTDAIRPRKGLGNFDSPSHTVGCHCHVTRRHNIVALDMYRIATLNAQLLGLAFIANNQGSLPRWRL